MLYNTESIIILVLKDNSIIAEKSRESFVSSYLTFLNVLMRFLLEFVKRKNFTSSVNFNTLLFENNFSFVLSSECVFLFSSYFVFYFMFLLNPCFDELCLYLLSFVVVSFNSSLVFSDDVAKWSTLPVWCMSNQLL